MHTEKKFKRHLISTTFYATYWREVLLHQLPDSSIGFCGECSQSLEGLRGLIQGKEQSLTSLDASKHTKS